MLKQRIITALILAAIVLTAIFTLPLFGFAVSVGVVMALAAWEWARFAGLTGLARMVLVAPVAALIAALFFTLPFSAVPDVPAVVFVVASAWWLLALVFVRAYPKAMSFWEPRPIQLAAGMLVLVSMWLAFVYLHGQNRGEWLIVVLLVMVACADVGAYFSGRAFGKHKLAPTVSPGKTIEGFVGGLACCLVFAGILWAWATMTWGYQPTHWWLFLLAVLVGLASVLGDLTESMFKRHCGIKDSGRILPGHGGIMDRLDGIVAAAPVFALIYALSGWSW